MKSKLLLISILTCIFSCEETKQETTSFSSENTKETEVMTLNEERNEKKLPQKMSSYDSIVSFKKESVVKQDSQEEMKTFQIDSTVTHIPTGEEELLCEILKIGTFHGDEVPSEYQNMNWYGLSKKKDTYFLENHTVIFDKAFDPVLDEEGDSTGIEVKVEENTENLFYLFSGINLDTGMITSSQSVNVPYYPIPNDTLMIIEEEDTLQLFATGDKFHLSDNYYSLANYRLFIKRKGKEQLIFSAPIFDDTMPSVLWIGDLDKDQQLDFIIDIATKYNGEVLGLYLSSYADSGEILKIVGVFDAVGC